MVPRPAGGPILASAACFGALQKWPSSAQLKWPALGTQVGTETTGPVVIVLTPEACLVVKDAGTVVLSTPKACGSLCHPRRRKRMVAARGAARPPGLGQARELAAHLLKIVRSGA